ncbi:CUGBP Elav-like family member 1 isoform X3 [Lepeophtheirus salmonis]|uniref:CUGBP Elav-like family member 1 isoform X3 n=1 Tax=Lepeophtheirus salmonis TaxID=72036 RepID=UPI003AF3A0AA
MKAALISTPSLVDALLPYQELVKAITLIIMNGSSSPGNNGEIIPNGNGSSNKPGSEDHSNGILSTPDANAIKMFVGQVPRSMNENDLKNMFEEFGPVHQINVLRDKVTGQSKGCCFVTFYSRKSALDAQNALHNIKTLDGMHHPIQMKPADTENRNERKLFIGMVSKKYNEEDIKNMFKSYGTIEECTVLRDTSGISKGCAFVTFSNRPCALTAIKAMHHSTTMEGCSSPLVVKFADTQKEKEQKKVQQLQTNLWALTTTPNAAAVAAAASAAQQVQAAQLVNSQYIAALQLQGAPSPGSNSAAGTSPNGILTMQQLIASPAMSVENGAMLQQQALGGLSSAPGGYNPYIALTASPSVNNHSANGTAGLNSVPSSQANGIDLLNSNLGLISSVNPSSLGVSNLNSLIAFLNSSAKSGSTHNLTSGSVLPLSHQGMTPTSMSTGQTHLGTPLMMTTSELLSSITSSTSPPTSALAGYPYNAALSNTGIPTVLSTTGTTTTSVLKQHEGPNGANLFIYHLPQEFTDAELLQTFNPFGNVISAKVFIDKQTKLSKCFGFVSYDNPVSAHAAIQAMNGFHVGTKRLKVQLKKAKHRYEPY